MIGKRKKKTGRGSINPVFFLFFFLSIALCLTGFLSALVLCIDRSDELFNAVRYQDDWRVAYKDIYQNRWDPLRGGFIDNVLEIPHDLAVGFSGFPSAALVALLLFPLLIFVVPVYDIFMNMDFTFLIMGWAPFLGGVLLFFLAALLSEMSRGDAAYVKNKKPFDTNQPNA